MSSSVVTSVTNNFSGFPLSWFLESPPSICICGVCKRTLNNPIQCGKGHNVCKGCIVTGQNCPKCNTVLDINRMTQNLFAKDHIATLKTKCKCLDNACTWIGTLAERRLRTCDHELRKCPHKSCSVKVKRSYLEIHKVTCSKREAKCDLCEEFGPLDQLPAHRLECPSRPIPCNDCQQLVSFKSREIHRATDCPCVIVRCPIFDVNCCDCSGTHQRRALPAHVSKQQANESISARMLIKLTEQLCVTPAVRGSSTTTSAAPPPIVGAKNKRKAPPEPITRSISIKQEHPSPRMISAPNVIMSICEPSTKVPCSRAVQNNTDIGYVGEINAQGEKHGHGTMNYLGSKAVTYTGSWEHDKRHGHGELKTNGPHGGVYTGMWKNDEKSGQGKLIYDSGDVYCSTWVFNKRNGHGAMQYANGDCYLGQWRAGNKECHGRMVYADGSVYEGQWKKDMKCVVFEMTRRRLT